MDESDDDRRERIAAMIYTQHVMLHDNKVDCVRMALKSFQFADHFLQVADAQARSQTILNQKQP